MTTMCLLLATLLPGAADGARPQGEALNLLIVTVDDMSADSVGAFGCKLAGTTPNIDRLAADGTRFGRAHVFKEHNLNAGRVRNTMRGVQTPKYLYLFNPWSDGQRTMATATRGTPTYRRMAQLAKTDSALAARHDLFLYRVPEELYDVENDPDCLENIIASPMHQAALIRLRERIEAWMVETGDPALAEFRARGKPWDRK